MISPTTKSYLELGLSVLASTQENTSLLVPGAAVENRPTPDQIALYMLCLVDELGELAKEMGYKTWKPMEIDNERVADEFADVLAFFGLITHYVMELTGLDEKDLAEAYRAKTFRNIERFLGESHKDPDYKGVTNFVAYARNLLEMVKG